MKCAEMLKLMGRMVLVSKVLERQKAYPTRTVKMEDEGPTGKFVADVPVPNGMRAWWEEEVLDKPRTGWVIGFRTLQEGYVIPESRGMTVFGDPDYEPAAWRTEKVIPCLLVAFWPTEKPVHVPMDGFLKVSMGTHRIYIDPVAHKMCHAPKPYRKTWKDRISDPGYVEETEARFREFMKNEMKDWPRDEKGHWKKKEK